MELILDTAETDLLLNVLNRSVADLREEIGKTENYDMRQDLKAREVTLKGMIQRLAGVQTH